MVVANWKFGRHLRGRGRTRERERERERKKKNKKKKRVRKMVRSLVPERRASNKLPSRANLRNILTPVLVLWVGGSIRMSSFAASFRRYSSGLADLIRQCYTSEISFTPQVYTGDPAHRVQIAIETTHAPTA